MGEERVEIAERDRSDTRRGFGVLLFFREEQKEKEREKNNRRRRKERKKERGSAEETRSCRGIPFGRYRETVEGKRKGPEEVTRRR